jgi:hypothetical protein
VAEQRPATVVVDTNVFSADLIRTTRPLAELYRPVLLGRRFLISYQTVAEIRFGARLGNWAPKRIAGMEERLATAEVVWPGRELLSTYVTLRTDCVRAGHALGQREHDADRWIAATAIHLGIPLVSHDGIFKHAPALVLETRSLS